MSSELRKLSEYHEELIFKTIHSPAWNTW